MINDSLFKELMYLNSNCLCKKITGFIIKSLYLIQNELLISIFFKVYKIC